MRSWKSRAFLVSAWLTASLTASTAWATAAEPAAATKSTESAKAEVAAAPAPSAWERRKTQELRSKADRKRTHNARSQERAGLARADRPHDAVAYFVNKRNGPIITRGSNVTKGAKGLDPQLYLVALEEARKTPFYSSKAGRMLSAGEVAAAVPGGALGNWSPLGPSNQGGRTRQLLIDPNNPDIMYAAAVGGGVWKTTNGGGTWDQLTDLKLPNIAVAALAMDPKNSLVLYAGTGEGFFNFDAIRGAGIYKSIDGGATWNALAATVPAPGVLGDFSYTTQIIVSPRNTQRIFATTRSGLFRSNDGGTSWTKLLDAAAVNGCQDVTMQLKRSIGYVFAACGTFTQATIYRALDSAASTFSAVFTTAGMGRTSLAIAPSNESYIYAMAASVAPGSPYEDGLLGVFRSTANGNPGSWTTQVTNASPNKINTLLLSNPVYGLGACFGLNSLFNQGWYDNIIAVDPLDPERVWAGGVDLFRSDDGGRNWGVAGYWWFDQGVDANYVHADHHMIRFHPGYNGTTNKKMYVANDGGIFRTDDARAVVGTTNAAVCGTPPAGMVSWTELNTNYITTQFYNGAVYPNGNTFFGGMQDNGTWRGTTAGLPWQKLLGGDGGYNAVDTLGDANNNNDVLFAEFTGLSLQKSTDGGANFNDAVTGINDPGFAFIAPFAMNEANKQLLINGGWYVWRTANQATNWTRASAITPGDGSVSAVATSSNNTNKAIVGMSDGYLLFNTSFLTANNVTAWANTRPRTAFVTSAAFDPNDSNVAYATYATFSGLSVYKSTDSGATWAAIPGTGANVLPRVPALTVVVDPGNSQRIYVGTDIGVYTSIDGGANWFREVTGFGNVSVEHLAINSDGTRRLYAFTHGRGAWRVDINP